MTTDAKHPRSLALVGSSFRPEDRMPALQVHKGSATSEYRRFPAKLAIRDSSPIVALHYKLKSLVACFQQFIAF
jgi:hypothetical protein